MEKVTTTPARWRRERGSSHERTGKGLGMLGSVPPPLGDAGKRDKLDELGSRRRWMGRLDIGIGGGADERC